MKKIYISPSDQDANAYARGSTNEARECQAIGRLLEKELQRCGLDATVNTTDTMEQRVAQSNRWGADLHLCIHTNAFNGQVQGTRMFAGDTKGTGYQVCQAIMEELAPITPGESDNITAWPGLYEVRNANAPTAYIEVGFHDAPEEALWIVAHKMEIAQAICKGLCHYYGMDYVPEKREAGRFQTLDDVPDYGKATVSKLLQQDYLVGRPTGLDLTEDMVRLLVILDRTGLFDK